ncbi:porin family protein [Vibrio paucivorans]
MNTKSSLTWSEVMKVTYSSLFIIALLLIKPAVSLAASSPHQIYIDTGYAELKGPLGKDDTWVTNVGYSYFFTPFIGFDVGYTDTVISTAEYVNSLDETIEAGYKGFYGGARIEHPIRNIGMLYAKGGLSHTTLEEVNVTSAPNTTIDTSGTNPYFGIGATIPSRMQPNLEFSIEYNYQDLEGDYKNSAILFGAHYRL